MSEIVSLFTVFSSHLLATTLRQFYEIVFALLSMTGVCRCEIFLEGTGTETKPIILSKIATNKIFDRRSPFFIENH